jgi:hypothetical protein
MQAVAAYMKHRKVIVVAGEMSNKYQEVTCKINILTLKDLNIIARDWLTS